MEIINKIKNIVEELEFDIWGVAKIEELEKEKQSLDDWARKKYYGNMEWFEKSLEKRKDILKVVPDAKSVICVAMNYYNGEDENRENKSYGQIARYAYGRDYHKIFDKKLKLFAQKLKDIFPDNDFKYYSDTGPVLERAWASRAGLGFVGKNTNLITQYGSWVLLGEIIADICFDASGRQSFEEPQFAAPACRQAWPAAAPVTGSAKNLLCEQNQSFSPAPVSSKLCRPLAQTNNCGPCRRCLDICLTGALESSYTVNAQKCISYLTIEYKGEIPLELRDKMGNWIFGCDMCQKVCPFNVGRQKPAQNKLNQKAVPTGRQAIAGSARELKEILSIKTDEEFLEKFAGSPLMRAKRRGLVRNACIAAGNSGDESLLPYLKECLEDNDSIIASHAKWAIEKLKNEI